MSDDSEPGEIKSPENYGGNAPPSSVVRTKRSTDERARHYKSEKRLRLERDQIKDYIRSDYKDYHRRDDYKDDKRDYDKREFDRLEKRDDKRELDRLEKRDDRREDKKQSFREEDRFQRKEADVRTSKEKLRLKDTEKIKRKSEEEKLKERRDEKREEKLIREKLKQISEELKSSSKKKSERSPSSSDGRKRDKKDPEKKKKKDKEGKKIKDKSVKESISASEKYQLLLKERLSAVSETGSGSNPHSPEEVASSSSLAAERKKKSLLVDSSDSSDPDISDEEMAPVDPSPVAQNTTPSPSPPPDPLAGLPPYYPALQGCRNVDHFEYLNRIEEGTYGVVFRARDKRTNETVALKKLKMEKEKQGFPITSLREINTLLKGQHENVVHVREIVVGSNMDKIYIVMNYVEHDLKALMENMKEQFLIGEVKTIMRQLCEGLKFLHDNWIIHRDIKTSNLLFSHGGILKIGDFGLAREYGSPLKQYTEIVVTLWYRAPELLLGCKLYSVPIDIWSAGCVFGELLGQKPLFPGKSEIDQLNKIFKELGTPNEKIWPGWSELPATQRYSFANHPYNNLRNRFPPSQLTEKGFNLLNSLLCYDPTHRITANEGLSHPWFEEAPLPVDPTMFPTWPAKSEMNANPKKKQKSPTPPSGGGAADKLENSGFKFLTANAGNSSKGPGFSLKF